ncbi:hypothetical protein GCM10011309_03670 [Litorimonas cladophorae]|uniref:DUF885 domain-containing protein n=1 Tax=Litorimonas cladophorae TaxID=1220491 RepID=A0A918KBX9_9PROT|nr:DUF885 domain-containing protein [Litorimonas cladophorae]GGX57856.1 hypothetical protein GCM10011309_03670 [Litorimonas cladophorae]
MRRIAPHTLILASLFVLGACAPATEAPTPKANVETTDTTTTAATEKARLNAWFEDRFMESVRAYPQQLTSLGIDERQDEWNDPSRAYALEQLDRTREDLAEMRELFDYDALDADGQLSYRLFEKNADNALAGREWWDHQYTYTQMRGAHSSLPTFLMNNHKINDLEDAENYLTRLETIDVPLDEYTRQAKAKFEKGIAPPTFVYDFVIESSRNIIAGNPNDAESEDLNLLLGDFKKKVEKLDLDEPTRTGLYERAIAAIVNDLTPAYERIIAEMERQKPLSSSDDGAWKLPDGGDYYSARLEVMTTTDMSATEIHELGLSEVDRIHSEMREIMKQVEFDGTLQEFFEFTRTDSQFFKPEGARGRAAYLKEATKFIDDMKVRLPEVFNRLPKAELEVRAVEAFREKAAGKAFYNRPAPDGTRPGIYYANLYRMDAMPVYQMEALAYHEGIPGHHMQLSISQELEGIPSFRKYGRFTAYSEGWGLYSEYLPKEMGLYQDPYSDSGRLAMELWRAARLVVDTGLHDKKWTREEATAYLMTNTPNPESDCLKAIERYIVMPGQATAYKIGMNKILELREGAKAELGDKFDIRDFHDAILATGPVPLSIMEEQVDLYIAEAKAG